MVGALIAALVAMTILCLVLGWACYSLIMSRRATREAQASRLEELMNQNKAMDSFLANVLRVMNSNVGGISKRIRESVDIAETIHLQAPELFKRCDGLAYLLHANVQFLSNLFASAEEGIDSYHRGQINEMRTSNRIAVFDAIYQTADIAAPSSSNV